MSHPLQQRNIFFSPEVLLQARADFQLKSVVYRNERKARHGLGEMPIVVQNGPKSMSMVLEGSAGYPACQSPGLWREEVFWKRHSREIILFHFTECSFWATELAEGCQNDTAWCWVHTDSK